MESFRGLKPPQLECQTKPNILWSFSCSKITSQSSQVYIISLNMPFRVTIETFFFFFFFGQGGNRVNMIFLSQRLWYTSVNKETKESKIGFFFNHLNV